MITRTYTLRQVVIFLLFSALLSQAIVSSIGAFYIFSSEQKNLLINQGIGIINNLAHDAEYPLTYSNESDAQDIVDNYLKFINVKHIVFLKNDGEILHQSSDALSNAIKHHVVNDQISKGIELEGDHFNNLNHWVIYSPVIENNEDAVFAGDQSIIGHLYVAIDKSIYNKTLEKIFFNAVISVSLLLVIISGIALRLFNKTTISPIINITNTIRNISENDYRKVEVPTFLYELTEIANAYNQAVVKIEKNSIDLEMQVLKRTEELVYAKEDAENANKSKSVFIGKINHDIKGPLTGIIDAVDLMKDYFINNDNPYINNRLNGLNANAKHLKMLVHDAMDITEIESGKLTFQSVECNLSSIMNDIFLMNKDRCAIRNIDIMITMYNIPKIITTDKEKLYRVLMNLITNSIKFSPDNSTINVRVKMKTLNSDNSGIIKFEVIDEGMGIAEEVVPTIFNAFDRGANDVALKIEGKGLGLSICKEIVTRQGGQIDVVTVYGNGCLFWFVLPITVIDNELVNLSLSSILDKTSEEDFNLSEQSQKPYVLVADDDPNLLTIYKEALNQNFQPILKSNGQDAIDAFNEQDYQLLLLDYDMPFKNGLEVAKSWRETIDPDYQIKVIMISGNDFDMMEELEIKQYVDEIVQKPVTSKQIKSLVEQEL